MSRFRKSLAGVVPGVLMCVSLAVAAYIVAVKRNDPSEPFPGLCVVLADLVELGMDPVQFGMILMMNLGLGLCTPPVGACLFIGCAIGKTRIEHVVLTIWPFYLAILVALTLTTFVPAVSLTLPGLFE